MSYCASVEWGAVEAREASGEENPDGDGDSEERVSRLEGGFKHLATKVDVAELRGDLHALESRLMRWIVGAILGSVAAAAAVTGVIVALVGAF